jgi:2'-5' RNA ligase
LLALAASVQAPAFYLQLDQLRCWSGGLLHLAPATPPEPLLSLAAQLQRKLRAAGFDLEQREYLPHLTLARDCSRPTPAEFPETGWQVDHFSLFLSETHPEGVHYRTLASWKLR